MRRCICPVLLVLAGTAQAAGWRISTNFEGGPAKVEPSAADGYRPVGRQLGLAVADYLHRRAPSGN